MAKAFAVLVFLTKILLSICQEDQTHHEMGYLPPQIKEHPSYSFGYGVADTHTGDVKTVWQAKDGDTVKGHYSVIEPDGSMRSVEYSSGPRTGFTATVNKEDLQLPDVTVNLDVIEEKALRDYDRHYDFTEDFDQTYKPNERKRKKHPYESLFRDYSFVKKSKYSSDSEPSEYTHSISIKHPHDEGAPEGVPQSHIGFNFDPDCKNKHKKESNYYPNVPDLDFRRHKYPPPSDSYKNEFDKYVSDASNMDIEKLIKMYKTNDHYKPLKQDEYGDWSPTKTDYHSLPDIPLDNLFSEYPITRPKKKLKPSKNPEQYESEDLDDYILVPKRKHKKPPRFVDQADYHHESEDEFEDTFDDDRYHKLSRPSNQKEIVRKIVKKKKPVINILDIFDI